MLWLDDSSIQFVLGQYWYQCRYSSKFKYRYWYQCCRAAAATGTLRLRHRRPGGYFPSRPRCHSRARSTHGQHPPPASAMARHVAAGSRRCHHWVVTVAPAHHAVITRCRSSTRCRSKPGRTRGTTLCARQQRSLTTAAAMVRHGELRQQRLRTGALAASNSGGGDAHVLTL